MARAREFDPYEALGKAVDVFWDKGYADTSMDDLVNAMGVARYGVYNQWGNKRELFIAALDAFARMGEQNYQQDLRKPDAGLAEIRDFMNMLVENYQELKLGCMICNAATEVAPHDPEIAAAVRGFFGRMNDAFRNALTHALKTGELKTDQDIDDLAEFLAATFRSCAVMARADFSKEQIASTVKVALSVLDNR